MNRVPVYLGPEVDEKEFFKDFCAYYSCSRVFKVILDLENIDYGLIVYEWKREYSDILKNALPKCLAYHSLSGNGCYIMIDNVVVAELVAFDAPSEPFVYFQKVSDEKGLVDQHANDAVEDVRSAVEAGMDNTSRLSRGRMDTILMSLSLDKCTVDSLARIAGGTGERRFGLAIAEIVKRLMEKLGDDVGAYRQLLAYDTLGKCGETSVVKVKMSLEDREMLRKFASMVGHDIGISKAVRVAVSYFVKHIDKGSISQVGAGVGIG